MGMDILSPFSFYGGKAKMASLICRMLDYDNTDIYIEPFGGACRVLLNKPRHEVEIYNDFGIGLYEFFFAMSKPELSEKVISALYDVKPDKELFYEMKRYKQKHENEPMADVQLRFKELAYQLKKKYDSPQLGELHRLVIKKRYKEIIAKSVEILGDKVIKDVQEEKAFQEYVQLYLDY